MIHLKRRCDNTLQLFEFQGEFENVELFDGVFDENTLQMRFKGFFLQGKAVKKQMTVIEKSRGGDGTELNTLGFVDEVILFDAPPRYVV